MNQGEEAIHISAGDDNTCAILSDKSVKCWGDNVYEIRGWSSPLGQREATAIVAGEYHTCVILSDKSVKCWGDNRDGQAGGGRTRSFNVWPNGWQRTATPSGKPGSPLGPGEEAIHIAAGAWHTCAILSDDNTSNGGSIKCWGNNGYGQTGGGKNNGNTLLSGTAGSPLVQGEEATHIAAGYNHTCAILSDKSVKCWGYNREGQAGRGSPLSQGEEATHIAAGYYHTCAILSDKSVKCWGRNGFGQTGGGSPLNQGEEATHIAAGDYHTCAILSDKSVKCWGRNRDGQTGGGSPLNQGEEATHIAAGDYHTCAILSDKTVKCWGGNESGQTGGGSPLSQGEEAIHIAAGDYHTCAILNDDDTSNGGSIKCWGKNDYKQTESPSLGVNPRTDTPYTATTIDTYSLCAILDDDGDVSNGGPIKCWGNDIPFRIDRGFPNLGIKRGTSAPYTAIAISGSCAILNDDGDASNGGPIKCWGENSLYEPGESVPLDGTKVTSVSASSGGYEDHTCAILSDKSVKCWGSNVSGQTGGGTQNGHLTLSGTPGNPLGDTKATAIAAGDYHTCAILTDDTIKCWGSNVRGQTGGGTPQGSDATKVITAGDYHTCAIMGDKTVRCWGTIGNRRLVDSGRPTYNTRPLGSDTVTAIVAGLGGYGSNCAILDDGDGNTSSGGPVKCWGIRSAGSSLNSYTEELNFNIDFGNKPATNTAYKATNIAVGKGQYLWAILDDDGNINNGGPVKHGGFCSSCVSHNLDLGNKPSTNTPYTATFIASGNFQTCVILDDDGNSTNGGPVKCWGWGQNDQPESNTLTPLGSSTAKAITIGVGHACAILSDDTLKCWGARYYPEPVFPPIDILRSLFLFK